MLKRVILLATLLVSSMTFSQGYKASPQNASANAEAQKELKLAEKEQSEAKAKFSKNPKDGKLKAAYVKATVKLGTTNMMSPVVDRKLKYKLALRYYREALKLDPKNAEALNNKQMIESIYKQMNRPIPQD